MTALARAQDPLPTSPTPGREAARAALGADAAPDTTRAAAGGRRGDPIRVLLVEDRPVARMMLADELSAVDGIEIAAVARDGDEAIRLVRAERPDVVLLDLVLPGKDGIETLKEIRAFSRVPVVLLTGANVAPETLEHVARRQGADAFIRKPSGPVSFDMYRITGRLVAEIERLARGPRSDEAAPGPVTEPGELPHHAAGAPKS